MKDSELKNKIKKNLEKIKESKLLKRCMYWKQCFEFECIHKESKFEGLLFSREHLICPNQEECKLAKCYQFIGSTDPLESYKKNFLGLSDKKEISNSKLSLVIISPQGIIIKDSFDGSIHIRKKGSYNIIEDHREIYEILD